MTLDTKPNAAATFFVGDCQFVLAAAEPEHFPPTKLPEVAFWGRSNVGKSTLVNGLTGRNHLARASKTPGRTQEILFFDLGKRLMLVDMPGYGHAKAPREERDRWRKLIHAYLQSRPQLRLICLLIDGRHGLLANDLATLRTLDRCGVSTQIVLTKIDQVAIPKRAEIVAKVVEQLAKHPCAREDVMMVSAEKRIGIDELRLELSTTANKPAPKRPNPKTLQ